MTSTDCTSDIALNDRGEDQIQPAEGISEPGSKPLKGLFFGFAATMTVGLALTSWYLGVRIVTSAEVSPAARTVTSQKPESAAAPATQPAELYLQVAGLGPKRDASFVRALESKGFHAEVRPAGIMIGPFATRADMEQAQLKLRSGGVLAIETIQ